MIRTLEQLRSLYAAPAQRAVHKQQDRLDSHCQQWIALSPLLVMATAGADGALVDASPRGGKPGFVKVVDERRLWIPDAGGNNRLDSLSNLLTDARIGLLFLIPGVDETLRVNGRAQLRDEPEFTEQFAGDNFRLKLVIEVQVQEAYLHCAKALMRSRLWAADSQLPRATLLTLNQIIHAQTGNAQAPESQQSMVQRYSAQIAGEQPQ